LNNRPRCCFMARETVVVARPLARALLILRPLCDCAELVVDEGWVEQEVWEGTDVSWPLDRGGHAWLVADMAE
jgi:hypothetical protein